MVQDVETQHEQIVECNNTETWQYLFLFDDSITSVWRHKFSKNIDNGFIVLWVNLFKLYDIVVVFKKLHLEGCTETTVKFVFQTGAQVTFESNFKEKSDSKRTLTHLHWFLSWKFFVKS